MDASDTTVMVLPIQVSNRKKNRNPVTVPTASVLILLRLVIERSLMKSSKKLFLICRPVRLETKGGEKCMKQMTARNRKGTGGNFFMKNPAMPSPSASRPTMVPITVIGFLMMSLRKRVFTLLLQRRDISIRRIIACFIIIQNMISENEVYFT